MDFAKKTLSQSQLPLIFANGRPAVLHNMELNQLKKFVPFLIKCDTNRDLPSEETEINECPSWWPDDLPFDHSILNDTSKSPREIIETLLKVASRCYQHHKLSYMIAFSSSLAKGHGGSKEKLTFEENLDGTTRIFDSKGQLVVVVRTNTRYYDYEEKSPSISSPNRRSARLTGKPDLSLNTDIVATDFRSCFLLSPRLTRIEDISKCLTSKNQKSKSRVLPRRVIVRKVVDDITNQMNGKNNVLTNRNKKSKTKKSQSKKKKRTTKSAALDEKSSHTGTYTCKFCQRVFNLIHHHEDHENICDKIVGPDQDIRDRGDLKDFFIQSLGLVTNSRDIPTEPLIIVPTLPPAPIPIASTSAPKLPIRTLRKVPARSKMNAFLKNHPLPLSSLRGQEFLAKFGERKIAKPGPFEYEKYCLSQQTRAPAFNPTVSTLKKHKLKPNQDVHTYTFGIVEKRIKGIELIMGMSVRSFRLFNKCKTVNPVVKKIPEPKVKEIMDRMKRRTLQKKIDIRKLAKLCVPLVELDDCRTNIKCLPAAYRKRAMELLNMQ